MTVHLIVAVLHRSYLLIWHGEQRIWLQSQNIAREMLHLTAVSCSANANMQQLFAPAAVN